MIKAHRELCVTIAGGLAAGLIVLSIMVSIGCSGPTAEVRGGASEMTQKKTTEELDPAAGVVVRRTVEEVGASSRGASMRAASPDGSVAGDFNGSAPEVNVAGLGAARGGGAIAGFKIDGRARTALLYVGGVFGLLAVGALYLRIISAAIALGSAGACLAAAFVYPLILLAVPFVLVAGVCFLAWKYLRNHEALRATVAGVANAPAEAKEIVKAEIGKQADAADDRIISSIKRADALPK